METIGTLKRNSLERIPELDGLRGVAILLVLIWHYGYCQLSSASPLISSFKKIVMYSWSGVDLFFVLSGFLIGGILLDNKQASNFFQIFYLRRGCRILPLYLAWLSLFILAYYSISSTMRGALGLDWLFQKPLPLWSYASFTQNIMMAQQGGLGAQWLGITWSLAIEEQFYLTLPLLIRYIPWRKLPYVLAAIILGVPLLRTAIFLWHPQHGFPAFVLMPCRADALLLGVFCAYLMRQEAAREYLMRHVHKLYITLGCLLWGLLYLFFDNQNLGAFGFSSYGYSILAFFYSCLLLTILIDKKCPFNKILQLPALQALGITAYGIYMLHQGASGLAHGLILGQAPGIHRGVDLAVTLLALALTLFFSRLSWEKFEKPIINFGKSFLYKF